MATSITDAILGAERTLSAKIPVSGASTPVTISSQILISPWSAKTDSYTLVLTDAFKVITINKATGTNLTVPPNSSVAFPIGTVIKIRRLGAGAITFVAGVGVTINNTLGTLVDAGQNIDMFLTKSATNTWYVGNGSGVTLGSSDIIGTLGYTPAHNTTEWTRVVLGTDRTFTSASYADVTGLSFAVTNGVFYELKAVIYVDSSNTGVGHGISINGPSLTSTIHWLKGQSGAAAEQQRTSTTYDGITSMTASPAAGIGISILQGRVKTSASGTMILRCINETGTNTITVFTGSYIEYRIAGV